VRAWGLRVVWVTLPLTAGPAASDALAGWRDGPRVVGAVLLWAAWGTVTVALFAPRPAGLTLLRVVAPVFALCALAAAGSDRTGVLSALGAVSATVVAAALAADADIAIFAVNGLAYGDERRFPLRAPPGLFLGPVPLARILVVGVVGGGPLLIADGSYAWGAVVVLIGAPLAILAARALDRLSRRWLVFVPAGVVVVDPLTLADPVLFMRGHVRGLHPVAASAVPRADGLDLRLGAGLGSLELVFDQAADLLRAGRFRQPATIVEASSLLVAVTRRAQVLETAAERRVRVEGR
jgi:hypothetical protein